MTVSWPDVLGTLVGGRDLSAEQIGWAMNEMLDGNASPAQMAGLLVGLRAKGETVAEISSMADAMLDHALPISLDRDAVDVVGSGGDRANTVNVSTMAAIVAAGAGARVVKHGNRAASSACGTADCLEALGVALSVPAQHQELVLQSAGIVFLFAPDYHPALRHVGAARRELAIATTFNFLGPLANPAKPLAQAIGVADRRMAELVAGVLAGRGARGLVFHGDDGLDELTTTTTSEVWMIGEGTVSTHVLDPAHFGLQRAEAADLVGGVASHNAAVARAVLAGDPGPVRDIVVLNAAAALLAFDGPDHQLDLAQQMQQRITRVCEAIDDGRAAAALQRWVDATAAVSA